MHKKQKNVECQFDRMGVRMDQQIKEENKQKSKLNYLNYQNQLLYKKYTSQNVDRTTTSETTQFINGLQIQYLGGFKEFQLYYFGKEYLPAFFSLSQTKTLVTNIIKKSAKEFKLPLLHFHEPFYSLFKKQDKYVISSQKQKENLRNQAKGTYSIIKEISNKEKLRGKKTKSQKKVGSGKSCIKNANQSFEFLRNLCKNIDNMCHNLDSRKCFKFIGNQLFSNKVEENQSERERKFREEVQQNCSKIDQKRQNVKQKRKTERNNCFSEKEFDDIYGLSSKRSRNKQPVQKARSMKKPANAKDMIGSIQTCGADYAKQYNYTECKQRQKQKKQRLLTSYSSHKLTGKSLDKANKNLQAYLRIFKSRSQKKEQVTFASQKLLKGVRNLNYHKNH